MLRGPDAGDPVHAADRPELTRVGLAEVGARRRPRPGLQPGGRGGRITVVHAHVPERRRAGIRTGWHTSYWRPWRRYLKRRGAGRRTSASPRASAPGPAPGLVLGERGRVRGIDAGQRRAGLDLLEEEGLQVFLVEAGGRDGLGEGARNA